MIKLEAQTRLLAGDPKVPKIRKIIGKGKTSNSGRGETYLEFDDSEKAFEHAKEGLTALLGQPKREEPSGLLFPQSVYLKRGCVTLT